MKRKQRGALQKRGAAEERGGNTWCHFPEEKYSTDEIQAADAPNRREKYDFNATLLRFRASNVNN